MTNDRRNMSTDDPDLYRDWQAERKIGQTQLGYTAWLARMHGREATGQAVPMTLRIGGGQCPNLSSCEVARALGVTQKTGWFLLHRIRLALKQGTFNKIGGNGGTVECDETFVGGLAKNMHKAERQRKIKGTGGNGKTAVMGLLERHTEKGKSKVRAKVIPNTQRETLHGEIVKHVEPGTNVYTDAWRAYQGMPAEYVHDFVDHMEAYVKGAVHTNGLENFWALFKRCLKGTHVSVEPFHLAAYVDSEAFRFNNRDTNDGGRFVRALSGAEGKRLTYKALTGWDEQAEGSQLV